MDIIELLEEIPATFWGVVLGSFFSIFGVWLSNRSSSNRLQQQFAHERILKTKERELTLRKEIYLEAAEAVSVALATLSSLANLEVSNEKVTERYLQKSPALAKVQVIGSIETINALLDLSSEYTAQHMRLFAIRHQLNAKKVNLKIQESQTEEYQKEVNKYLDLIKQHVIDVTDNKQRWDILNSAVEFNQKRVSESIQKSQGLSSNLYNLHSKFMGECTTASVTVSKFIVPFVTAIRKELELPLAFDDYKIAVSRSLEKQVQSRDDYLRTMSAAFGTAGPDKS